MSLYTEFLDKEACAKCKLNNRVAKDCLERGVDSLGLFGLCNECYSQYVKMVKEDFKRVTRGDP